MDGFGRKPREAELLREALLEQFHRHCRRDLVAFATEAMRPLPMQPHHLLLLRHMQQVVEGQITRLIVLGPPGCGKSTLLSYVTPVWAMAHRPGLQIIAVTHTTNFAERTSERVQRLAQDHGELLGYSLSSEAKGHWRTSNGGEYLASSVGQRIRGARAQLLLLDDLFGGFADAQSETIREGVYSWFKSDAMSRPLEPTDAVVLTSTAYHEQDLMSRLLREEAEHWHVLRLPAISEGESDPLGRPEGEPLAAGQPYGEHLLARKAEFERTGFEREWLATYQASPQPPGGALFKPDAIRIVDYLPPRIMLQFRAWDFAGSEGRGDWTVGVKMVVHHNVATAELDCIITDVRRMRGGPEQVRELVKATAQADGASTRIFVPQDPGSAGVDQAASFIGMLAGYSVEAVRQTGDKVIRAMPYAAQLNAGKVTMLRAPWNAAYLNELGAFPAGKHDDQVDASSLLFNQAVGPHGSLALWLLM